MCYCFDSLLSFDEQVQTETEGKKEALNYHCNRNLLTPAYVNEIMACIRNTF